MTWLVNELNRRIRFLTQEQTPNSAGGLTQTYKQLAVCWAACKPVGASAGSYVRNVQVEDAPTHEFKVRRNPSMGLDTYGDGLLRSSNYVFLLTQASPAVGRLFRILSAANAGEADEYLTFLAKEMGQLDALKGIIK